MKNDIGPTMETELKISRRFQRQNQENDNRNGKIKEDENISTSIYCVRPKVANTLSNIDGIFEVADYGDSASDSIISNNKYSLDESSTKYSDCRSYKNRIKYECNEESLTSLHSDQKDKKSSSSITTSGNESNRETAREDIFAASLRTVKSLLQTTSPTSVLYPESSSDNILRFLEALYAFDVIEAREVVIDWLACEYDRIYAEMLVDEAINNLPWKCQFLFVESTDSQESLVFLGNMDEEVQIQKGTVLQLRARIDNFWEVIAFDSENHTLRIRTTHSPLLSVDDSGENIFDSGIDYDDSNSALFEMEIDTVQLIGAIVFERFQSRDTNMIVSLPAKQAMERVVHMLNQGHKYILLVEEFERNQSVAQRLFVPKDAQKTLLLHKSSFVLKYMGNKQTIRTVYRLIDELCGLLTGKTSSRCSEDRFGRNKSVSANSLDELTKSMENQHELLTCVIYLLKSIQHDKTVLLKYFLASINVHDSLKASLKAHWHSMRPFSNCDNSSVLEIRECMRFIKRFEQQEGSMPVEQSTILLEGLRKQYSALLESHNPDITLKENSLFPSRFAFFDILQSPLVQVFTADAKSPESITDHEFCVGHGSEIEVSALKYELVVETNRWSVLDCVPSESDWSSHLRGIMCQEVVNQLQGGLLETYTPTSQIMLTAALNVGDVFAIHRLRLSTDERKLNDASYNNFGFYLVEKIDVMQCCVLCRKLGEMSTPLDLVSLPFHELWSIVVYRIEDILSDDTSSCDSTNDLNMRYVVFVTIFSCTAVDNKSALTVLRSIIRYLKQSQNNSTNNRENNRIICENDKKSNAASKPTQGIPGAIVKPVTDSRNTRNIKENVENKFRATVLNINESSAEIKIVMRNIINSNVDPNALYKTANYNAVLKTCDVFIEVVDITKIFVQGLCPWNDASTKPRDVLEVIRSLNCHKEKIAQIMEDVEKDMHQFPSISTYHVRDLRSVTLVGLQQAQKYLLRFKVAKKCANIKAMTSEHVGNISKMGKATSMCTSRNANTDSVLLRYNMIIMTPPRPPLKPTLIRARGASSTIQLWLHNSLDDKNVAPLPNNLMYKLECSIPLLLQTSEASTSISIILSAQHNTYVSISLTPQHVNQILNLERLKAPTLTQVALTRRCKVELRVKSYLVLRDLPMVSSSASSELVTHMYLAELLQ